MVSAAPEPAENSAGAALVPAPWEISARAALRAKPQARVRGILISGDRSPPATEPSHALDRPRPQLTTLSYTIARALAVMAVTVY